MRVDYHDQTRNLCVIAAYPTACDGNIREASAETNNSIILLYIQQLNMNFTAIDH